MRLLKTGFILILFSVIWFKAAQAVTLEDSVNGYKLEHPLDWGATTFPNSTDLVKANIFKDSVTGVQVRIDSLRGMDFDSFVKWYNDDFMKQMQGRWEGVIEIIEQKNIFLAGQNCSVTAFDLKRGDGQRRFFKVYLIPYAGKVYVMQCGSAFDTRSNNEPIIDSIASSFSFTR